MKKVVLLSGILFLGIACKKDKCRECHYDKNGGEVELGMKCGDEIETLEANGYSENGVNYTVHCGEDH